MISSCSGDLLLPNRSLHVQAARVAWGTLRPDAPWEMGSRSQLSRDAGAH